MTKITEEKPLLNLTIAAIKQLTPRIRAYELRDINNQLLPLATAGSYLQIPVTLKNGSREFHHYSICSNPTNRDFYEIAVLLEPEGQGGSLDIHNTFETGMRLHCKPPENNFHLHADASPSIFIAGGIGITPIKPMMETLALRGRRFQLHYAGRSLSEMAFSDLLKDELGDKLFTYPKDENQRLDIMHVLADAPHNAQFYVCGPRRLIDDVYASASALGIAKDRIQTEFFYSKNNLPKPVILELIRSNKLIHVDAGQSLLTAVRDAHINISFDCCVGDCGSCATKVIEGEVEHRDHVLSDADKENGYVCLCVSQAKSDKLILDL